MQVVKIGEKNLFTPKKNPQICVYIRNYAKKAIMLTIKRQIRVEDIRKKIQDKMNVPAEEQILFYGGRMIDFSVQGQEAMLVGDRQIIHIVDQRRVRVSELKISLRKIQPESQLLTFTVPSSTKVKDFIMNILSTNLSDICYYFLVYTGRQLNPQKTFQEQYIQNGSEIFCVHRINNLKNKICFPNRSNCLRKQSVENLKTAEKQNASRDRSEQSSQNSQDSVRENEKQEREEGTMEKNKVTNPENGIGEEEQKFEELMSQHLTIKQTISSYQPYILNSKQTKSGQVEVSGQQAIEKKLQSEEEKVQLEEKMDETNENIPQKGQKSFEYLEIISQRIIFTEPKIYLCKQNSEAEKIKTKQLQKNIEGDSEKKVAVSLFDPHEESSDEDPDDIQSQFPQKIQLQTDKQTLGKQVLQNNKNSTIQTPFTSLLHQ